MVDMCQLKTLAGVRAELLSFCLLICKSLLDAWWEISLKVIPALKKKIILIMGRLYTAVF